MQASITSPQVVRGDVGCHADGNAARTVDEEVRKLGREHGRLLERAVIVLAKLDGLLVEVIEQRVRDLAEPALGVPLGGRRIAIDGAEIPLAVDERQAQGEVLRHAHQRVVDGKVAVRMVLAHHLADHAGAFDVFLVPVDTELAHPEQDPAMHGLEAVADVGGARDTITLMA